MSMKVNKNGKRYPVGVIPQSLYDDVEDLKDGKVDKSGDTMTGDLTLGKQGTVLTIRAGGSKSTRITSSASGSDKDIVLPNQSGTLALTSDIPTATLKSEDVNITFDGNGIAYLAEKYFSPEGLAGNYLIIRIASTYIKAFDFSNLPPTLVQNTTINVRRYYYE